MLERAKMSLASKSGHLKSYHFKNWAKTYHCHPERFYQPDSFEELKDIIGNAHRDHKKVRVVGAGHSPGDIHCTTSWMINLDKLNNVVSTDEDKMEIKVEAGMRLYDLNKYLDKIGWAVTNLGSISEQSVAGAICTGTHGSSLKHKMLSSQVVEITLLLADGSAVVCTKESNEELYRAACLSLGALGVITHIKFKCVKAFDLDGTVEVQTLEDFLSLWEKKKLWESAEFVRCWWFPYSSKVIINKQEGIPKNSKDHSKNTLKSWFKEYFMGYLVQQLLLLIAILFPSLIPFFERLIFAVRYGSTSGIKSKATKTSQKGFNMDCLFSQWVDEWAIPIDKGPEAIRQLDKYLSKDPSTVIPSSSQGIYVHSPIEIRVVASDQDDAYLANSFGGDHVYIGVIMYRPYGLNTSYKKYFEAYEWLMASFDGRPHWAKQHLLPKSELEKRYPMLPKWLKIREQLDPEGMFLGEYHERHLIKQSESCETSVNKQNGRKVEMMHWDRTFEN